MPKPTTTIRFRGFSDEPMFSFIIAPSGLLLIAMAGEDTAQFVSERIPVEADFSKHSSRQWFRGVSTMIHREQIFYLDFEMERMWSVQGRRGKIHHCRYLMARTVSHRRPSV